LKTTIYNDIIKKGAQLMKENRMDRSKIIITTHKESEEMDAEYWSNA
jgi:hypothetical protein